MIMKSLGKREVTKEVGGKLTDPRNDELLVWFLAENFEGGIEFINPGLGRERCLRNLDCI